VVAERIGLDNAEQAFNHLNMRSDLTARARIRDAALARFGADGVAATTVRAVAADAGVVYSRVGVSAG